jgi:hypothetical protein
MSNPVKVGSPEWLKEARKYRRVCECGERKKSYPLMGRGSNVWCCPKCGNEEEIIMICKESGWL